MTQQGAGLRSGSLSYMPALDGLRAAAVLMVFAAHAFPGSSFPGTLGVDVFFVISGFLITLILVRELDRDGSIRLGTFYVRRLLRLYPALLAMIVGVLVLDVARFHHFPAQRAEYGGVAAVYLSNLYVTFAGRMEPFSHTWSLAQEEQFYLVWPVLLLVLHRAGWGTTKIAGALAAMAVASLVGGALATESVVWLVTRGGGLLVGCVVALLVARRPWHHVGLGHLALAGIGVVMVLVTAGQLRGTLAPPAVTLLLPFVILMAAYGQSPVNRVLSTRPMRRLGLVSYAFYLWHYPILIVLASWDVTGAKGAAVALVLTLIAAELSYRVIELPALRLKEQVGVRRRRVWDRAGGHQVGARSLNSGR